jgi:hypothetical protein
VGSRQRWVLESVGRAAAVLLFVLSARAPFADELPAELEALPLFSIDNLQYLGGFRFPTEQLGVSTMAYAEGPIAASADGASIFAVGHAHQQAIAQFAIPALVNSKNPADFRVADPLQGFAPILNRPASGNPQAIDRIGGMQHFAGKLVVNTYVYYDAPASVTHTTLVVEDAAQLATSAVGGYYSYSAHAHAAGWISPIPEVWQSTLGGTFITGHSSGLPIIGRLSVGPSAFAVDLTALGGRSSKPIPVVRLLDFSLGQPLGARSRNAERYLMNEGLDNDLWTHLSRAVVGFVVPGTRSYLTLGVNGGMTTGVGYKLRRDNGAECEGYCAHGPSDYANYYWLWDLNDLAAVKSRKKQPSAVLPYAYGKLEGYDVGGRIGSLVGGSFDATNGVLYLAVRQGADGEWTPVVIAFKVPALAP